MPPSRCVHDSTPGRPESRTGRDPVSLGGDREWPRPEPAAAGLNGEWTNRDNPVHPIPMRSKEMPRHAQSRLRPSARPVGVRTPGPKTPPRQRRHLGRDPRSSSTRCPATPSATARSGPSRSPATTGSACTASSRLAVAARRRDDHASGEHDRDLLHGRGDRHPGDGRRADRPDPGPHDSTNVRGSGIRGGVSRRVTKGDVVIIPGHTPHWWSELETDIEYLIFRPDPDNRIPATLTHSRESEPCRIRRRRPPPPAGPTGRRHPRRAIDNGPAVRTDWRCFGRYRHSSTWEPGASR